MSKPHILIATNSTQTSDTVTDALKSSFQVSAVHSSEDFFDSVVKQKPDIAVVGARLKSAIPEKKGATKDGYEVCIKLKSNTDTCQIPLILLSTAHDRVVSQTAYESGADDYISDSSDGVSIRYRAEKLLKNLRDSQQSLTQAREAMQVAMEAMANSSELGKLLHLLKDLHQISQPQKLADSVSASVRYFSLSCCVMVDTGSLVFSGCESDSMEASLMQKFAGSSQRMTHLGNRTLINSHSVVMLIKNMPVDEETRYGRFKDLLVMLTDIASDRALAIEAGHTLEMKQQRISILNEVIHMTEDSVMNSGKEIEKFSQQLINSVRDMVNAQDNLLQRLGLDDDQEDKLRALTLVASDTVELASGRSDKLISGLKKLVDALKELQKRQ